MWDPIVMLDWQVTWVQILLQTLLYSYQELDCSSFGLQLTHSCTKTVATTVQFFTLSTQVYSDIALSI